ncbi:MAG TPA: hypothetical protein VNE83_04150 [Terriglobales bacterium]|nr:hypothetical protein [Terriglobales bacterium]
MYGQRDPGAVILDGGGDHTGSGGGADGDAAPRRVQAIARIDGLDGVEDQVGEHPPQVVQVAPHEGYRLNRLDHLHLRPGAPQRARQRDRLAGGSGQIDLPGDVGAASEVIAQAADDGAAVPRGAINHVAILAALLHGGVLLQREHGVGAAHDIEHVVEIVGQAADHLRQRQVAGVVQRPHLHFLERGHVGQHHQHAFDAVVGVAPRRRRQQHVDAAVVVPVQHRAFLVDGPALAEGLLQLGGGRAAFAGETKALAQLLHREAGDGPAGAVEHRPRRRVHGGHAQAAVKNHHRIGHVLQHGGQLMRSRGRPRPAAAAQFHQRYHEQPHHQQDDLLFPSGVKSHRRLQWIRQKPGADGGASGHAEQYRRYPAPKAEQRLDYGDAGQVDQQRNRLVGTKENEDAGGRQRDAHRRHPHPGIVQRSPHARIRCRRRWRDGYGALQLGMGYRRRLLVGVVRAAHQRPRLDVPKTQRQP